MASFFNNFKKGFGTVVRWNPVTLGPALVTDSLSSASDYYDQNAATGEYGRSKNFFRSTAQGIGDAFDSRVNDIGTATSPVRDYLSGNPVADRKVRENARLYLKQGGTGQFGDSISAAVGAIQGQTKQSKSLPRQAPRSQTLNERLINAAKRGELFTYDDVFRSAAAQGANNEAIANQHIKDVRGWGSNAISDIRGAGSQNARQNVKLQGQLGSGFAKMLGATGMKGSPLSKLGGINSAEMAANARADNGWFSRQAANQSQLNDFYSQALRRQANNQAFMAQQDAYAKAADAKQRDIQSLVNLGQLEAQQGQNGQLGAIDPAEVKDRYLSNLQAVGPNRTDQAYAMTQGELGGDNAAQAQLDKWNAFYSTHPVYRRQLLSQLFPSK